MYLSFTSFGTFICIQNTLATFNESLGIHVILDPIITLFSLHFMSKTYWEGEVWELEPLDQNSISSDFRILLMCGN